MKLLDVRNLKKSFGENTVLNGINLSVSRNEFIVVAGANGSGKTVLMKHLNGLLRADSGEVLYRDVDIFSDIVNVRKRIGLVFQHSDMQFVGHSVSAEIAFGPENLGFTRAERDAKVDAIAETLRLRSLLSRRPYELSGGEKKRVAIASVLVMEPEIILLDEPFAGLDYPGVVSILETLEHLYALGHTLAVITHDLEKGLGFANRLIIMRKGSVVYDAAPCIDEELYRDNAIRLPYGVGRDVESLKWN